MPDRLIPHEQRARFQGIVRADGRVATRNHLGVFIVGNCAATAARKVVDWFTPKRLAAFSNVDGVVPFIHELGCGMEKSGEPMDLLRRSLGGGIRNPNVVGAVVLALGCERNNIYAFLEQEGLKGGPLLKTVVLQEVGGTANAIEAGIAAINGMLPMANEARREPVSAEHLVLGLQVGTDAAAELGAQAAIGVAVDLLVASGGTAIVSGTASAGPALAERAATLRINEQVVQKIHWWNDYTAGRDTRSTRAKPVDASTLPYAGTTPLQGFYGYGHAIESKGLVLVDSPSFEAVSTTGQLASGATLICVVTKTGSAFGAPAVPTVKLATDSTTFARMEDDLDLDGGAAAGASPEAVNALGRRLFDAWLAHASGRLTKSEELGVGDNEFVPWPIGVFA
jgi:altronate hydrolase